MGSSATVAHRPALPCRRARTRCSTESIEDLSPAAPGLPHPAQRNFMPYSFSPVYLRTLSTATD